MYREWLYSTLTASSELMELMPGGIWQSTSLTDIPAHTPFIIYRLGTSAPALGGDDDVNKRIQPIQLFVHDRPGDYARIDAVLVILKQLLAVQNTSTIVRCEWLEESEDLSDDEMHTIVRFARYQLIH